MAEFETRVANLSDKRQALLALLEQRKKAAAAAQGEPRLGVRPAGQPVPLSFGQEALWFVDQLDPGQPTYNIVQVLRLRGPLDVVALRRSFDLLVQRHEALRTVFAVRQGRPFQHIDQGFVTATMVRDDLRHLPEEQREAEVQRLVGEEEVRRPFDLAAGPLFRTRLIVLDDEHHVLTIGVHHSVADGWSVGLLNGELSVCYGALVGGGEPVLGELPVQFGDF
ncbi:condensation domain-containing protein, partial [Plantactinospora sp. B24E8]|uniref:condensation domain-containing protein n=1 Tax=Plantactinospora sp. B24E8 TaxID=3153567 RepID=UPI00325D7F7D